MVKVIKSLKSTSWLTQIAKSSIRSNIHHSDYRTTIRIPINSRLSKLIYHKRIKTACLRSNQILTEQVLILCDIIALQALSNLHTTSPIIYWAFELKGILSDRFKLSMDVIRSFRFAKYLDDTSLVLVPSEVRKNLIEQINKTHKILVVGNYRAIDKDRVLPKMPVGKINLFFGGRVTNASGIPDIIKHVSTCSNLNLHICGILDDEIASEFVNLPANVTYHGHLRNEEMKSLALQCDVSLVTYNSSYDSTLYFASPNKLGDALAYGHMIIGTNQPFIKQMVTYHHLGYVTEYSDISYAISVCNNLSQREIYRYKLRSYESYLNQFNMNNSFGKIQAELDDSNS